MLRDVFECVFCSFHSGETSDNSVEVAVSASVICQDCR